MYELLAPNYFESKGLNLFIIKPPQWDIMYYIRPA